MIQGLRLAPWIWNHRSHLRNREKSPWANDWLNCKTCMFSDSERPRLKCGWIPKSQWPAGAQVNPVPGDCKLDTEDGEATVCPGYLAQMPQVFEAARAHGWKADGALREFYEDPPTDLAKDSIDILATELRTVEGYEMRKATEGKGG